MTSHLLSMYPLITTPRHRECRDFYVQHFGFAVGFEASWFVWLTRAMEGGGAVNLAFMHPDHPSSPPGPEAFTGVGILLTLQVDDARGEEARLRAAGVTITWPGSREPWGQVRFQCADPAGLVLDVVEQVEPAEGFWDRYMQ